MVAGTIGANCSDNCRIDGDWVIVVLDLRRTGGSSSAAGTDGADGGTGGGGGGGAVTTLMV